MKETDISSMHGSLACKSLETNFFIYLLTLGGEVLLLYSVVLPRLLCSLARQVLFCGPSKTVRKQK